MTAATVTPRSRRRGVLSAARDVAVRFTARTDGVVGLAILLVFAILAIAPQLFVGPLETAVTATGTSLEPPSLAHLLGTDELGRDILNLTVHGARISMTIGLMATLITIALGAGIGIISGYLGGKADVLLMWLTDVFLVLPNFVLAIALAPILLDIIGAQAELFGIRATLLVIVVVIGVTSWATTARIIRSQVLSLKERMFVDRARVIGTGPGRIMRRHILPNVLSPLIVATMLSVGNIILLESALSFLGLGVQPPLPSWGNMLTAALEQMTQAPAHAIWPGAMIFATVLAVNLLGDGLQAALDPRGERR